MSPSPASVPQRHGRGILIGSIAGCALALLGGWLVHHGGGAASYGMTMFLALPVMVGAIMGAITKRWPAALAASALALCLSMLVLWCVGLEGAVCILLASPLLGLGIIIGALIGSVVQAHMRKRSGNHGTHLLILPVLAMLGVLETHHVENHRDRTERIESITDTCILNADPLDVWQAVVAVDEVSADKPLLLRLGLPIPRYCTITGQGVGAHRTCHFNTGTIDEEVTAWEPGHQLDLRIVRCTAPGRHWLRFLTASYTFDKLGPGRTRVTRRTMIASKLEPGWYWRGLEHAGVLAEHRYVFASLARRFP